MTLQQMTESAGNSGNCPPVALVLGATGGIGGTVARRLMADGWHVRALHRNPPAVAAHQPAFQWIKGDAMNRDAVVAAAMGASLIVHAVNPPGYRNWGTLVLPMIDNSIIAAKASGARIFLPGTVYNYGPDALPDLSEESPQNPKTRKGTIRVELERRLRAAAGEGVPVLIVRSGDFFGPDARSSWFSQGLVKPGKPVMRVTLPAAPGIGHQWAYLPDVAETVVRLLGQAQRLPMFAVFQMAGVWDGDGTQMTAAIARVTGRRQKYSRFPWWLVRLLSPAVPLFFELQEMRYLWRQPVRMSNSRLLQFLGDEPSTPLDKAVQDTLVALGCLDPEDD